MVGIAAGVIGASFPPFFPPFFPPIFPPFFPPFFPPDFPPSFPPDFPPSFPPDFPPFFPPDFRPSLPSPSLSLGDSGNAAGGRRYQQIFLTNFDGSNSYSPGFDSFEGPYPEWIVEGNGPASLTVTASRSGFISSSSTINFTLG